MIKHTNKQKAELRRKKQRDGGAKVRRRARRDADPRVLARRAALAPAVEPATEEQS